MRIELVHAPSGVAIWCSEWPQERQVESPYDSGLQLLAQDLTQVIRARIDLHADGQLVYSFDPVAR